MNTDYSNAEVRKARRNKAKTRKGNGFRTFYIIYVIILVILLAAALMYVRKSLVMYEMSQPDKFIADAMEKGLSGEIGKYMDENYFSSKDAQEAENMAWMKSRFEEKISSEGAECKISPMSYDTSEPLYNITVDGQPYMDVRLCVGDTETRLGILTVCHYKVKEVSFPITSGYFRNEEGGTYACTVKAPANAIVTMNGKALDFSASGENAKSEEFQYLYDYVDNLPYLKSLSFSGLLLPPEIEIDPGYTVAASLGNIEIKPEFTYGPEAEAMLSGVPVIDYCKDWSRLMTNDLTSGGGPHNVNAVLDHLITGSYIYNMARAFSTSVDITFVSGHSIKSWTEESVTNYIKYTDNCVSCDVRFLKNMILKTGAARTDEFNNRVFFVYRNGGWYMCDMQAL